MVIACFFRGPFDGKRLILPEPFPKFVIPKWDSLLIEWYYLRSGQLDENTYAYLIDDSFASVTGDERLPPARPL